MNGCSGCFGKGNVSARPGEANEGCTCRLLLKLGFESTRLSDNLSVTKTARCTLFSSVRSGQSFPAQPRGITCPWMNVVLPVAVPNSRPNRTGGTKPGRAEDGTPQLHRISVLIGDPWAVECPNTPHPTCQRGLGQASARSPANRVRSK